jgi:capsular exopolysaccharide synthesis family protein
MFDRAVAEGEGSQLLNALRRRWWVIALVAIVAAGGAYVFANRKQKEYSATSALLFQNNQLDQLLLAKQVVETVDPARQAATNLSLVGLPAVAEGVAAQLHIPAGWVAGSISFSADPGSDVLRITATDPSPVFAAKIANSYVQQYIAFRQSAARAQLAASEALVNRRLAALPPSELNGPIAQALLQDRNNLDLLSSAQTGDAQQVETASIPGSPSSTSPKKAAMIGLLLGLLAAAALVVLLERQDKRIKDPAEIETLYRVPVLGAIPISNALTRLGAVGTRQDQEAFSRLRAQLRYFDVDRDIKRVMVTSAQSADGKSLTALNLARAAARADDKRVLLIEADLRRPSLAEMLGLDNVAGLGELLSHSQDLGSGLRELAVPLNELNEAQEHAGFDVLLAGGVPPNPVELIGSQRMIELLDHIGTMYDLVVIDTPPIGAVSDPIPLVHQVDGVLVVSRVGHSRRAEAAEMMTQLRSLKANVFGVVINGAPPKTDYYYYYDRQNRPSRFAGLRSTRRGREEDPSLTERS